MAAKARIFAAALLVCMILIPSLASAFVDHLPKFLEHDSRKKDVTIFPGNNVVPTDKYDHMLSHSDEIRKERSIKEKKKKGKKFHDFETFKFGHFGGDQQEEHQFSPFVPSFGEPQTSEEIDQPENIIGGLQEGFYQKTCPQVEQIIKNRLIRAFQNDSSIAAAFPRLFLHDCFVNGCDGSLLLDNTPSGAKVEKLAAQNGVTVRGFEVIDQIKAELEKTCPGIVSCADILAYLSRDAFVVSGLPNYNVLAGRRDGMESLEANVVGNLPQPDETVDQMIDLFKKKGLNEEDLVVLIGAHSIGVAHCFNFLYRLDIPEKAQMLDPRLAGVMRFTCTGQMSSIPFDSTTQYKMDSVFYKQLMKKRGLLESDEMLAHDPRTRGFVQKFGNDEMGWFDKFGKAMTKLGAIQVLTGNQGQIRKQCRAVN